MTRPDYTPDANADRSEVPDAYKWSLDALYDSPAAWEAEKVLRIGISTA